MYPLHEKYFAYHLPESVIEDRKQKYETSSEAVSSSKIDVLAAIPDKNSFSSHEDDHDDEDRTSKAKVISLRKSVKKSYDDLPELGMNFKHIMIYEILVTCY